MTTHVDLSPTAIVGFARSHGDPIVKNILGVIATIIIFLLLFAFFSGPGCIVENRNEGGSNFGADQHAAGLDE